MTANTITLNFLDRNYLLKNFILLGNNVANFNFFIGYPQPQHSQLLLSLFRNFGVSNLIYM